MLAVQKGIPVVGLEEEGQGIGPILGLSSSTQGRRKYIRRTTSVDMSSKEWLSQCSPYKKIALPGEFSSAAETATEEGEEKQRESKEEPERPSQFDIWSAIQLQKTIGSSCSAPAPAPYIHPLVKHSASLLSEKSLEICTESLGSESGSDGFSSSDDVDHYSLLTHESEAEDEEVELKHEKMELGAVKHNCSISRKSPPRSFPPPLSSLSRRDGPCLHMRSHREDGRLVLEAIPVPTHNYLHAQRLGGRLVLTLINPPIQGEDEIDENNNVDNEEEEEEEEDEEEEGEEEVLLVRASQLEIKEEETQFDPGEEENSVEKAAINKKIVLALQVTEDDIENRLFNVNQWRIMLRNIRNTGSGCGSNHLRILNSSEGKSGGEREDCKKVTGVLPLQTFNGNESWWRSNYPASEHPNKRFSSSNKTLCIKKAQDAFLVTRCKGKDLRRPFFILETRCVASS